MKFEKVFLTLKKSFKKVKIYYILIFFLFSIFFCSLVNANISDVPVSLTIFGGGISASAPASLDLGTINVSKTQEVMQGTFNDDFWVQDLDAASGYTTTLVSDGLISPNGAILTGIYLMAGNNGLPRLLFLNTGDVKINSVFSGDYYSIFETPVVYIYKSGLNYGTINKYGDRPSIRVVVPPFTQPGGYSGVIYFDLK